MSMKSSLALYIDKWYIVGAVSTDGITRPVNLPNKEDRIWLYFYEDVANNEISYGKGFQGKFHNNEPHYYGDVFSLITQSSAKYTMFNRSQPMRGIFKSSKIFDDLRKDMGEEENITTYISFSKDISYASRYLFIEELKTQRFDVKGSVARISHLALEYAAKTASYTEEGYYLALNACNENLHYSLYQKTGDLFCRANEEVLMGLGTDVRRRAIIEHVVEHINEREQFLKTEAEREREYLRMNQYVDDWLVKLASARDFIPIQLTNVTFSRDPFKDYSVQVKKSKIDERTNTIVRDIVNVIVHFVKDAKVSHEQIKGILFLGNTFTNTRFKNELRKFYNLDFDKIITYKDADLYLLVNAYTSMDLTQFSATEYKVISDAKADLRRIQIAEQEAQREAQAQQEAKDIAERERQATETQRRFKDAMDMGYNAEREHDFDKMEDCFRIALTLCPEDKEAKQKHDEAQRKKTELSVKQNQYKEIIQHAKSAFDNSDYETAKSKAEQALSFKPDSKEALRIIQDASRRIKSQKELERYLDRAALFFAQKAYAEAMGELQKARLLDVDYKEIEELETKIKKEQQAVNQKVAELSAQLNSVLKEERYEDALSLCNELIEVDFVNSRKWSARLTKINIEKERAAVQRKRLEKLYRDIDSAQWNEDWNRVITLCQEALEIKEEANVRDKLKKAEEKVASENKFKFLDQTMAEIKDLILHSDFLEARKKIKELLLMNLNSIYNAKVRELNRLLFQKEDEAEKAGYIKQQGNSGVEDFLNNERIVTGKHIHPGQHLKSSPGKSKAKEPNEPLDWNFGSPNPKSKQSGDIQHILGDVFFDTPFKGIKPSQGKTSSLQSKISNDDFDF